MKNMCLNFKVAKTVLTRLSFVFLLLLLCKAAFAAGGDAQDLSGVANQVRGNFKAVAKLITAAAYIAGFGFAFAAILKFKAHKDNPTQIPVGTPIALIFIAAALIFLPTIFGVAGKTMFKNAKAGGVSGVYETPGTSSS
jgi:intracellular multiplication protein IcmD